MRGRLPVPAHSCQRIGAAEARWAHNPKVLRSKLRFAILSLLSRLAQLVERKILNLVVVGSSPTVGVLPPFFGSKSDNYISHSKILGVPLPPSRLAQLVERKTLNLVVVGSSPTVGVTIFSLLRFFFPQHGSWNCKITGGNSN